MAQPTSRQTLSDYCKRQLGAPVLEINVAEEQIDDLIDDALQYFHERHFDGVIQTLLKYQITQGDIDRGRAPGGNSSIAGITTETTSATVLGNAINFDIYENSNFIQIPPSVLGVFKIFHFGGYSNGSINYPGTMFPNQFLDGMGNFCGADQLSYYLGRTYQSELDFLLTTEKQIRFNKRQDRLYIDIDWRNLKPNDFLIIDCYRLIDPSDYPRVWNDSFLKKYVTALIKRQWGMNLIKFQGVKLPGGVELNGRQIYDDAQKELDDIKEIMMTTYELPPLDMVG